MALPKSSNDIKDAQKIDPIDQRVVPKKSLNSLDIQSNDENIIDIDQPITYGELAKTKTNELPSLPDDNIIDEETETISTDGDGSEAKKVESMNSSEMKEDNKQAVDNEEELSKEAQQKTREEFEEKVVEKVVYKEKGSRKLLPSCSCRSCSCFGCLTIILIIVLFGLILYFRPPFVWNIIKETLNGGYNPPVVEQRSQVDTRDKIQNLIQTEPSVQVTEADLQALINDKAKSTNYRVDIEPNYLRLSRDIDNNPKQPLWIILEFGQESGENVKITKLGFEKVNIPDFMRKAISESIVNALRLSGDKTESDTITIINYALDLEADSISNVSFDKDQVTITTK